MCVLLLIYWVANKSINKGGYDNTDTKIWFYFKQAKHGYIDIYLSVEKINFIGSKNTKKNQLSKSFNTQFSSIQKNYV